MRLSRPLRDGDRGRMMMLVALWYILPGVALAAIGFWLRRREESLVHWLAVAAIIVGALMVAFGIFVAIFLVPVGRGSGHL